MKIFLLTMTMGYTYANICNQKCGPSCSDEDADLINWDMAGFDSASDCKKHACTTAFPDGGSDWHTCEEGARELEGRKYNHIVKMVKKMATTNWSLRELFRRIQNYGCHCFPGQTREVGGHGPALDQQDVTCRTLSRCHRCISMQYGDNTQNYRFLHKNGDIDCERNLVNGNGQAAYDLCQCDAQFARDIASFWKDEDFNNYFWLKPNQMNKPIERRDPEHQSKFSEDNPGICDPVVIESKADECCGSYPFRYPYDSDDKSCCDNSDIFNPLFSECCDDGTIAKAGEC